MTPNQSGPATPRPPVASVSRDAISKGAPAPPLRPEPYKPARGGEDRRRSQRVLLRVKAFVFVMLAGKEVQLEVTTLSVHAHGALVAAKQHIPVETKLLLEHSATHQRVSCKVARPPRAMPEGFHTALEFSSAAPDFWKIAFPATDWIPIDC